MPTSPAPLHPTVEAACHTWAPRPAITSGGVTLTYGELWQRVQALAAAYRRIGVGRGDRVLCQLRNCAELVIATAAAWQVGAVHVGADNDLTGPELAALIERLDAAALVFQPPHHAADPLAAVAAVEAACPATTVILHGADDADHAGGARLNLSELTATGDEVAPDLPGRLDPAIVFLTSGTTGEPKAVVEPAAAHWAKMQFFADAFRPGPDDVQLLFLPASHVFGSRLALLTLLRGGHLVLAERFSPTAALETIEARGVTTLPAVPAHLRLLRRHHDPARHDVASLRWVISAAANLPRDLAEWAYATLSDRMMVVYGCSEGFTTVTTEADAILAGSVGDTVFRGPPGTPAAGEVAVVDPQDRTPLPPGDVGEVAYRAATPVRYWDQPDAATDGWYHTGDLGFVDALGRIHLVGRRKELINRGGLHVSPTEVETVLVRHPTVDDGAVVGVPDPVLGEAVCACITGAGAHTLTLDDVRGFLGDRLARHKLPDALRVVDEIPRTEIGKVDRATLAARLEPAGA